MQMNLEREKTPNVVNAAGAMWQVVKEPRCRSPNQLFVNMGVLLSASGHWPNNRSH